MGWTRMQSQEERKPRETIRGFMPFTEGANVEGTLYAVRMKEDGRGFFLIRASKSATVNVRDADSKTGQGKAQIGELIGIRKVGATKSLANLPLGTMVSVTYLGQVEHTGLNPKTGNQETSLKHHIAIDVYKDESEDA